MKKWLVLVLSLLLVLAVTACSKPKPTLKVTVAQQGTSMVITADTGAWKLGKDGHMHVQLNDGPVAMPSGNTYTIPNRAPGKYKVYVELADPDHNPIGVDSTVEFEMK